MHHRLKWYTHLRGEWPMIGRCTPACTLHSPVERSNLPFIKAHTLVLLSCFTVCHLWEINKYDRSTQTLLMHQSIIKTQLYNDCIFTSESPVHSVFFTDETLLSNNQDSTYLAKSFLDKSRPQPTQMWSRFIRPLCVQPAANHESYGQHVSIHKV